MGRGFFVTGTDTGVGKTVVSCALVRGLRDRGIDVGVMKPIETGVDEHGPQDAIALRRAGGDLDPLADICPQRFALPAAPNVAAAVEGQKVDLGLVEAAFRRLSARRAAVVVEGAGGLLAPTTDDETMADLARRLGLPLIVVARASLGTINHTRLTLEFARSVGLEIVGVVICHAGGTLSGADLRNLGCLRSELGSLRLGEIPPLAHPLEPAALALDERPPFDLDLGPLLARLS